MSLSLIDMRLSTYLRSVLPLVLIAAVMAAAARLAAEMADLLEAGIVLQLAVGTSTGGVVYAALIWHSGLPAVDDARRVLGRWAKRR
jgi:predicted regulator of Ras-like GTPase activity (Roadblock/LC7/MglB family)